MTKSTPTFYDGLDIIAARVQNADGTGLVTVYSPAAAIKLEALGACSDDGTLAHDVLVYITKGGVDYLIGCKNIAINGGNIGSAVGIDLLDGVTNPWLRRDENGNPYLILDSTCVVKVKVAVAMTAAKVLSITGHAKK